MVSETESRFTKITEDEVKEGSVTRENGEKAEFFLSPGFKSAAAMAGWDEEDLIIASFVVEETPERSSSKRRRRSNLLFKSPPSSGSRRKQRIKRSPVQFPIIDLDEVIKHEENNKPNKETKTETQTDKKITGKDEKILSEQNQNQNVSSSNSVPLPCIDKLRDELSCAICLEICFEPSTTTCGHSFCKKCLRSAADKCGRKCPKCRQLISNGRYCTVNTVLWNTIQLLFPQEVEARRAANTAASTPSPRNQRLRSRNKETVSYEEERVRREDLSRLFVSSSGEGNGRRRRMRVDQDRDAALALRLQRREFASAFGVTPTTSSSSTSNLSMARANLRAMASRAVQTQQRRQGH